MKTGKTKTYKKNDPENQPYTDILITCSDPLCSRWHTNVAALRVLYLLLCSLHSHVQFLFLGCFSFSCHLFPLHLTFIYLYCCAPLSLVLCSWFSLSYVIFICRKIQKTPLCFMGSLLIFHVKTWNKRSQTLERRRKEVDWLAGMDPLPYLSLSLPVSILSSFKSC